MGKESDWVFRSWTGDPCFRSDSAGDAIRDGGTKGRSDAVFVGAKRSSAIKVGPFRAELSSCDKNLDRLSFPTRKHASSISSMEYPHFSRLRDIVRQLGKTY